MKTLCLISTLFTLIVICESLEIVHNDHLTAWTSFPASGHRDDNMQHEDSRKLQKRDANSQLAFLSFAMALLNTIVNIISAVSNNNNNNNDNNNNNMNQNMNNVQSNNGRGLLEAGVVAWLEEKVAESAWLEEKVAESP